MFRRILVPLDGAARAEKAIPVAARLAKASGGSLVLLQVINTPLMERNEFMYEPAVLSQADIDTEISKATKYLTTLSLLDELEGIGVQTLIVVGTASPSIVSAIQNNNVDLVIMCSHGEKGLMRWVLGSVAQKIVRQSPVPVLVLRDGGPTLGETASAPRALVSLDGSHLAESAILPAARIVSALAGSARGALHLVHVVASPPEYEPVPDFPPFIDTPYAQHEEEDAPAYMKALTASLLQGDLAALNLDITWSVVVESDVTTTLARMAEKGESLRGTRGYELIAMATHGRSGLQRWAVGSFTERTLTATKLPLLIVRPRNTSAK